MFKKSFLKEIAKKETVPLPFLEKNLKAGKIVIPLNKKRSIPNSIAIGEGLRIKINANIGTSTERLSLAEEIKKLKTAIRFGADTVMDLSIADNLSKVREKILQESTIPVGTVPIYEAAKLANKRKGNFDKMNIDDILEVIEHQAREGVDFFTIHAGILRKTLSMFKEKKRTGGIVSRGGAIIARWMQVNKKENLLFVNFEQILDIAKRYNITISLGDALRPGAIADSTDKLQIYELKVLSKLVKMCLKKGVQVMVEGPGHIKLDEIGANVYLQKKLCFGVPFYVLGPIPTDIACGYDHITSAIGGAIAGMSGADFLCVVTPAEHLRHPSSDDIKEGVIASRIAAHSVDILKFKSEWQRDRNLSRAREKRDWDKIFNLSMDKEKAKSYRKSLKTSSEDICTMCGEFCSLKIINGSRL